MILVAAPAVGAVPPLKTCNTELTQTESLKSLEKLSEKSRAIWTQQLEILGELMRRGLLSHGEKTRHLVDASLEGLGFLDANGAIPENLLAAAERLIVNLLERVAALGLDPKDQIIPGFLFANESGALQVLAYGSEVPEGWRPADAGHINGLMDSFAYTQIVAAGYQVIQLVQREGGREHFIIAQHDIGHMIGLSRDASYMRKVRGFGRWTVNYVNTNFNGRVPPSNPRGFYISEALHHGDRAAVQEFFARLGVSEAYNCESLDCVKWFLKDKIPAAQNLYRELAYKIMIPYGGGMVGQNDGHMGEKLFSAFDPYFSFAHRGATDRTPELIFHFMQLSKISLEDHIEGINQGHNAYLCSAYKPLFNWSTPQVFKNLFCP